MSETLSWKGKRSRAVAAYIVAESSILRWCAAVVLTLILVAPRIAADDGEPVPGSLADWGCWTVQSVLDGLPRGSDYMVINLETGAVRATPRTFEDAGSGEWRWSQPVGAGAVIHTLLRSQSQADPSVTRLRNKYVQSRSDCKRNFFFTHDRYELDTKDFTFGSSVEIIYRLFLAPTVIDLHSPGRSGAHFLLGLENVTVDIDALTDQRSRADAIRQQIWNRRADIEDQCCNSRAGATAVGFINDTLDQFNLRIADLRLAGEQEIVLILEPQVAPCVPGTYYTIVNKGSEKVLGVAGGSLNDGAPVVQWDRDGTNNQKWSCVGTREGYVTIVAAHSRKLLNVAEASPADGGQLIQWPRGNADNERWRFQEAGDGYYNLVAKHSGKVLGVAAGSRDRGAKVVQWRRDGTDNQAWRLEAVLPCVPGTYYTIVNKGSGKVLGVARGNLNDGAPVVQWDRDGTNNQKWSCVGTREGYVTIVAAHSGKLLNVSGASPADGARVIQWPRGNEDNESWRFQEAGDGYYNLVAKHSGKVLGVAAGSRNRGAEIVQWRRDGSDNQAWRLEETMPAVR